MLTGVGLQQSLLARLNSSTPKTPCLVQESGTYHLCKPSYSQFCVQLTTIGYHINRSRSGVSLNDTIQLADLENPLFGARIWDIYLLQAEL